MWFFLSAAPLFAFFLCSRLQAAVCHRCSCSGVGHPWMWHLRGVPALFRLPMGHSFPLFSFSPNYLPSTVCLLFLVWFLLSHLLSNFHRGTRTSLTHYFPSSGKPLSSNRVVALCLLQLPRLLLLICTKPSTFTPVIPASPSAKKKINFREYKTKEGATIRQSKTDLFQTTFQPSFSSHRALLCRDNGKTTFRLGDVTSFLLIYQPLYQTLKLQRKQQMATSLSMASLSQSPPPQAEALFKQHS